MKYWVWIDCSECPPDSSDWDDGPFDTREEAEAYGEDYIDGYSMFSYRVQEVTA